MSLESQTFTLRTFPAGLILDRIKPIISSYNYHGQTQILVGSKKLHAFNLLGEQVWVFETKGKIKFICNSVNSILPDRLVILTETISEILLSGTELLLFTKCDSQAYFFDGGQKPNHELYLHEELTAIGIEKSPVGETDVICIATRKPTDKSGGIIQLYNTAGDELWKHSLSSCVTKLHFCYHDDKQDAWLAGDQGGILTSLNSSGQNNWELQVMKDEIISIAITHSSSANPRIVVGGKKGGVSFVSFDGNALWSVNETSDLLGLACGDFDKDGDDEILAVYANRICCYRQSGEVCWKIEVNQTIWSFDLCTPLDREIMVCVGNEVQIINAQDGSLTWKANLNGKGIACCKWSSNGQIGWAVCIQAKQPEWKLFGWLGSEKLDLGFIDRKSILR